MMMILRRLRPLLLGCLFPLLLVACGGGSDFSATGSGATGSGASGSGTTTPSITSQPASITAVEGQPASFSVSASGGGLSYQWLRSGTPIAGATGSAYSIPAVQLSDSGTAFTVSVTNAASSVTSAPANLVVNLAPPSLANDAALAVNVMFGQTAAFSVQASGSQLSFQWLRNGLPIAGATSAGYQLNNAGAADQGAVFTVAVSNAVGTVTSQPFTLSVTAIPVAPGIVTAPTSVTVYVGQSASFTVSANGTQPLSYQWLRNGAAITGAQSATYTIASTAASDSGAQFSVQVSNVVGAVTSPVASLTVKSAPGLSLLAGNVGGPGSLDGTGSNAAFNYPSGVATDSAGNVYVTDSSTNIIRKITPAGMVSTLAGTAGHVGSTDGNGAAARFNGPMGVAVDSAGNVYVADTSNGKIREITPAGVVSTLAAAGFDTPSGVAVDSAGNVYVADSGNNAIRKITAAGVVSILAGSTIGQAGSADGTGAAARFNNPLSVSVDSVGNVYVADSGNSTIRKITATGVVSTLAGSTTGQAGSADGTGSAARFNRPSGVTVDGAGNLYVADTYNQTIRQITPAGVVSTLAGTAGQNGSVDGTGVAARFNYPLGVAIDSAGNVYVGDSNNNTIREITPAGMVSTLAGTAAQYGSADGIGAAARFTNPLGVAVDSVGNVYLVDSFNGTIRQITAAGVVSTLAGTAGQTGSTDGTGAAARFNRPSGVSVDSAGNVYVADSNNQAIRKITPTGVVSTLAGTGGQTGSVDGTGAAARFSHPSGVAVDSAGNVYVADTYNSTIRKITPAGVVSTLAGTAAQTGSVDGTGSAARFNNPRGVAVDSVGNLYVADSGNNAIRQITAAGVVSTLAGTAGPTGSADGTGAAASFNNPWGVTVDSAGNAYVADAGNNTIRKITPAGVVSTVVGVADGMAGVQLGNLPGHLSSPYGVTVDFSGALYITTNNGAVKAVLP